MFMLTAPAQRYGVTALRLHPSIQIGKKDCRFNVQAHTRRPVLLSSPEALRESTRQENDNFSPVDNANPAFIQCMKNAAADHARPAASTSVERAAG
jgi:hypothetical protein